MVPQGEALEFPLLLLGDMGDILRQIPPVFCSFQPQCQSLYKSTSGQAPFLFLASLCSNMIFSIKMSYLSRTSLSLFLKPCRSKFLQNQSKSDKLNFVPRLFISFTNVCTSLASSSLSEHLLLSNILDIMLFVSLISSTPMSTASPASAFSCIVFTNRFISSRLTGRSWSNVRVPRSSDMQSFFMNFQRGPYGAIAISAVPYVR
ncbi:hypothetical protein QQP08_016312 [Theobroma cacao]|nr:hypothetical protein QQP08_016312 [Theobroma cacao]